MISSFKLVLVTSFAFLITSATVVAGQQTASPAKSCDTPIVSSREVDKKLKILDKPAPKFSNDEMEKYRNQEVVLVAVFCGSGEIINFRVLKSISDTIDAKAIEAARKIRYTPAEKDGQKVSSVLNLVYRLSVTRIRN